MHPFDDNEATSLEVIDATMAGEAVEPEYAELAELTLILGGQRPEPSVEFTSRLDQRVARRFAPADPETGRRARRWWFYAPGAAVALAGAVALAIVIGSGSSRPQIFATAGSSSSSAGPATAPSTVRAASGRGGKAAPSTFSAHSGAAGSVNSQSSASASASTGIAPTAPAGIPAPSTSGRQVVQSAQLALSTRPSNVDTVAQEVFDVVSAENGVVDNSEVTATNNANGYAQFQLSIPSANLSQAMGDLSRLHGAAVVSRTDATQDITGQVGAAGRALADARALRTSLLRQLQNATTTSAIDSLETQIHDAEASISSDIATLNRLHHQVDFSQVTVTINASMVPPVHPVAGGDSFTLGKAAHDASRVLVVAAGVALIALAVLIPLSMVGALVMWVICAVRRRRREQALDLV